MIMRVLLLATGILAALTPARAEQQTVAPAGAQTAEATQTAQQPDPQIGECAQAQPVVNASLDAALEQLDQARQTNSAAALRAAADDLQATLLDVRARLAPCAAMQPAGGHAGHVMPSGGPTWPSSPNVERPPATQPGTPVMQPGSPRPAPGAVNQEAPAPPTTGAGAPAGVHAGHTTTAVTEAPFIKDPRCNEEVEPTTSPQAFYQGRTYYFCSESDRQRFVADPARYLGTPAGPAATDPHPGHTMPTTAPRAPARDSGDPHAGHVMPSAPDGPAPTTGASAARPAPPTSLTDLKCGAPVDPKTAPRMLYQGRMYYFCSEQERAEFAKEPGSYATGSAQATPAHAH